jgi:hypothetical protein
MDKGRLAAFAARSDQKPQRLHIEHGVNGDPPRRRQANAQQSGPSYLWNSTTQELIPILPEDHPDYNLTLIRVGWWATSRRG